MFHQIMYCKAVLVSSLDKKKFLKKNTLSYLSPVRFVHRCTGVAITYTGGSLRGWYSRHELSAWPCVGRMRGMQWHQQPLEGCGRRA